jgi:hypothetical protein
MNYKEATGKDTKQANMFAKPLCICRELNEWEKGILLLNETDFVRVYKKKIQDEIEGYNLRLRLAELTDIDPVYNFIINRFHREYLEDVSRYDLFRFIKYGHGLILENANHEIMGCLFEIGYEKILKISYSIRLGIHESLKSKGLGRLLTVYSCLLAMENGSQIKTGLISYNNLVSLHIHVNQAGWLIDTFYHELSSLGTSFEFSLPLTPEALLLNRIDLDKVQTYIDEHHEGTDYRLIQINDIEAIKTIYKNRTFKIAAIIMPNQKEGNALFFALPVEVLYDK